MEGGGGAVCECSDCIPVRSDGDCAPPPPAKKLHGEIMIIEIKDFHCSYTGKHALVQLCGVNNLKSNSLQSSSPFNTAWHNLN